MGTIKWIDAFHRAAPLTGGLLSIWEFITRNVITSYEYLVSEIKTTRKETIISARFAGLAGLPKLQHFKQIRLKWNWSFLLGATIPQTWQHPCFSSEKNKMYYCIEIGFFVVGTTYFLHDFLLVFVICLKIKFFFWLNSVERTDKIT